MTELDGVLFKEIVEQGLREFPNECCGVDRGQPDGVPVKVFPMKNIDASPATYRLDGKEQLQVFDEIDERGLGDVGDLPLPHALRGLPVARPTAGSAFYPEARYLIVSLQDRDEPVLRSFFITGRRGHRGGAEIDMSGRHADVHRGAGPAVLAPHHPAQHRRGRAAQAARRQVLVIGAGGLGSPIAMYLAAAGIGKLGIVDFDEVDVIEPAAPDPAHDRGRRPPEGGVAPSTTCARSTPRSRSSATTRCCSATNVFDVMERYDVDRSTAPTTSRFATW